MIPDWDPISGNLPPGEHVVTWTDLEQNFGFTPRRRQLLIGLRRVIDALQLAGCQHVWVNGSFATSKPEPGDFDCCWSPQGINPFILENEAPTLLDFSNRRAAQKAEYGGECFIADWPAAFPSGALFLDFFQTDKYTGERKGILRIDLPLPPRASAGSDIPAEDVKQADTREPEEHTEP